MRVSYCRRSLGRSEQYGAFKSERTLRTVTPTDSTLTNKGYTGQEVSANSGLIFYQSRWYDPCIMRWLTPDTVIPDQYNPLDYDRYAYVRNSPITHNDPTGHFPDPTPPPYPFLQQAEDWLKSLGLSIVGDPTLKSIYANGADLVAQVKNEVDQVIQTIAVELKDVTGNVNLGTLGSSEKFNDYGGSITRIIRSADRLISSSVDQIRIESEQIKNAIDSGNLQNMLITTGQNVSLEAQKQFNYVYSNFKDGVADAIKALPAVISSVGSKINIPILVVPNFLFTPSINPYRQIHVQD
jgi:RHS repeat-associated protein